MLAKQSKYSVVAVRGPELILSSPSTFSKLVYRELPLTPNQQSLLLSGNPSLLPILQLQVDPDSQHCALLLEYYDCTLAQLPTRTYDEGQLVNTLQQILHLLKDLQGYDYGMLDKGNVCFYDGEVRLIPGESKLQLIEGETMQQRDLRVLGVIIAELATGRQGPTQQLLAAASKKYSPKMIQLLKTLVDPVPSKRQNVWKLLQGQPADTVQKREPKQNSPKEVCVEIENAPSPKNKVVVQQKSKSLLAETSNTIQEYNLEYFVNKIQRIDDLVNECLKRSKRLIEKSENRLK